MNESTIPLELKNYFAKSSEQSLQNKFMNIKEASEKVDFCLELLLNDKNLEQLIFTKTQSKDNDEAEKLLNLALDFAKSEDYVEALTFINSALCLAPIESKILPKLYENRAKIFFHLDLYQQCLENINIACEIGKASLELEQIRDKCVNAFLSKGSNNQILSYNINELKLSYPPHQNIPYVAECIQLSVDKVYGRNLITDRDLRPGDIIMMERPFAVVIDPSASVKKCSNCLSFNYYNLIPCPETCYAMFCNKSCYQEAYKKFHKHERLISDNLRKWFNGETCVALRLLLLAFNTFKELKDFETLVQDVGRFAENQFSFDYNNPDEYTIFKTLCSLTTVECDRTPEDLFKKAQITAVLYQMLQNCKELQFEGNECFIKKILYQFIQATTINTFPLYSTPEMLPKNHKKEDKDVDFAISTYPLSSFLSHSCSPNVRKGRAGINNEIMLIFVVRPIKAFEKICDSYDQKNNHLSRSLEERRTILYNQYFFVCQCEACIHDYPQEKNLISKLKPFEWHEISAGFQVQNEKDTDASSRETTLKNIEAIGTFLNDFDQLYPCVEIITAQKQLHKNMKKLCTKPAFFCD